MSAEQQQTLIAVITAINDDQDIYAAVRADDPASTREVSTILRILRLPDVHFKHGEAPNIVLDRVLDLLRDRLAKPSLMENHGDGYW